MHEEDPSVQMFGEPIAMELEEDVAAELDDFLTMRRLGLVEDASRVANEVLWRHSHSFPVFAEMAAFYIEQAHLEAVRVLALTKGFGFRQPDEKAYARAVSLYAKKQLASQTLEIINHGYQHYAHHTPAMNHEEKYDSALLLFLNIDKASAVEVRQLETSFAHCLRDAAAEYRDSSSRPCILPWG